MRLLFLFFFIPLGLYAEFNIQGNTKLESNFFLEKPSAKNANAFTLQQVLEFEYSKNDFSLYANVYAQIAYNDSLYSKKQTSRSFVRLDELYTKYDFENSSLQVGKSIKHWGALELRNIVDVFNKNDLRGDMFDRDKIGAYNTTYTHYTENAEISFSIKALQEEQKIARLPYVYNLFPQNLNYTPTLGKEDSTPTLYLSYSGTTYWEYPLDYAFIYTYGYDSQTYLAVNTSLQYQQHMYKVHKLMTYNTLVLGATLIKLEAIFASVIEDEPVSDYAHFGFGVEHSFENFENGTTFSFIGEYYKYITYESEKLDDKELFEAMQNDLFIGGRYLFNDVDNSSIVGGFIYDEEYKEQTYYLEYQSRIFQTYNIEWDYYYIKPSKNFTTPYALLEKHQRMRIRFAYYF